MAGRYWRGAPAGHRGEDPGSRPGRGEPAAPVAGRAWRKAAASAQGAGSSPARR